MPAPVTLRREEVRMLDDRQAGKVGSLDQVSPVVAAERSIELEQAAGHGPMWDRLDRLPVGIRKSREVVEGLAAETSYDGPGRDLLRRWSGLEYKHTGCPHERRRLGHQRVLHRV